MLFGYTIAKTQLDYALLEAFLAFLGDGQQGGRHRVGGGSGGATFIDANITNGCELYGMNRMYAVHQSTHRRKIEMCEIGRKHMEQIEASQFDNIGSLYWQKNVLN